jgi:putative ABC transport system permease protein
MLVVTEIGVALVLLIVSLAFVRSYQKMLSIDPGFQPQHVLVAGYRLPQEQYPTDASVETFNRDVVEQLSKKPGVLDVGIGITIPSSGTSGLSAYTIEGQSAAGWKLKFAAFGAVYGNYFRALGIPLIAGRTFTEEDRADSPLVIVMSQSMAQHSWPGENPIGKRMHVGNPRKNMPWATVVGIVGNTGSVRATTKPMTSGMHRSGNRPFSMVPHRRNRGSVPEAASSWFARRYLLTRSSEPFVAR